MAKQRWKLTDEQWQKIEPLLPKPEKSKRGGRPWADNRKVFEGILWILRTGAPWADLPKQYPSPSTCWRRLRDWEEQGVWLQAWRAFLAQLDEKSEAFVDGSFAPAKKGPVRRNDQTRQGHEVDGGGRQLPVPDPIHAEHIQRYEQNLGRQWVM
ncbi:MAG TPA: IS5 family transposase [Anaerohalosphaeraceae bacterium]|jgi:transposase|nr:IS5 family transposase [Anaerohalosphaeraceae bacterium]HQI08531.1 IS5 family transposase [Anaerohalosphaeraceae bacterium]HQJ68884.1 IS5 family transposase [Anaerohalosphaeraceae bacterium]